MKNIPEKIYLQIGEDPCEDFNEHYKNGISWCAGKIYDNDIEYIRMPTNGEDKKAILINKAVCEKYQISYDQFLSKSKKREIAQSRQVAHYVIRKNTKLTLKKIGELAGGIAHDNVLYSIRTIEKLMSVDKQLFNDVNELSELF